MKHKQKLKQALQELDALKEKVKGLIEPKLEVGKWYRCTDNSLLFFSGISDFRDDSCGYGFLSNGGWADERNGYSFIQSPHLWKEATPKEVEQDLIKEAKRRGYEVGKTICRKNVDESLPTVKIDKITFPNDNGYRFFESCIQSGKPFIEYNGFVVFSDGKWAEIIEKPVDKFADLKEAHKNGAVIQVWNEPAWITCVPNWHPDFQYRIKPEKSCLDQDIDTLKSKYPQFRFTITVEDNI